MNRNNNKAVSGRHPKIGNDVEHKHRDAPDVYFMKTVSFQLKRIATALEDINLELKYQGENNGN